MKYNRISRSCLLTTEDKYVYEKEIKKYILLFIKKHYPKYLKEFEKVPIDIINGDEFRDKLGEFKIYDDGFYRLIFYSKGIKPSIKTDTLDTYYKEVVLHETCHMLAYLMGEDKADGSEFFENLLLKHGSKSSSKSPFSLTGKKTIVKGYFKQNCFCKKTKYVKKQQLNPICSKCEYPINYSGFYVKSK